MPQSPDTINTCRVYGFIFAGSDPVLNVQVEALLQNPPQYQGQTFLYTDVNETRTDQYGYWELNLVQGQSYALSIPYAGIFMQLITVPSQTDYNATDFLNPGTYG